MSLGSVLSIRTQSPSEPACASEFKSLRVTFNTQGSGHMGPALTLQPLWNGQGSGWLPPRLGGWTQGAQCDSACLC